MTREKLSHAQRCMKQVSVRKCFSTLSSVSSANVAMATVSLVAQTKFSCREARSAHAHRRTKQVRMAKPWT